MQTISTLTNDQINNQINVINTTRFLMENTYGASEVTINELEATLKALNNELEGRA